MERHRKFAINVDAEVVDRDGERDLGGQQHQFVNSDLLQLLTSAQPDNLGLVGIHFQAVSGHPDVDIFNALNETCNGGWCVYGWCRDVHLCVVGVGVRRNIADLVRAEKPCHYHRVKPNPHLTPERVGQLKENLKVFQSKERRRVSANFIKIFQRTPKIQESDFDRQFSNRYRTSDSWPVLSLHNPGDFFPEIVYDHPR